MSVTTCKCERPHVKRVTLSTLHIMGPGTYWVAARPGGMYLVGHGWHYDTWEDAIHYATSPQEGRA